MRRGLMLIIAGAGLLCAALIWWNEGYTYGRQISQAARIAHTMRLPTAERSAELIRAQMGSVLQAGEYRNATLSTPDGRTLAELTDPVPPGRLDDLLSTLGLIRTYTISVPVRSDEAVLGTLTLLWVNTNIYTYLFFLLLMGIGGYMAWMTRMGRRGSTPAVVEGATPAQPHQTSLGADLTPRGETPPALLPGLVLSPLDAAPEPVLTAAVNAQGIFISAEGRGIEAFGAHPHTLVGWRLTDLAPEARGIFEPLEKALTGESHAHSARVSGRLLECWYGPTRDADGQPAGGVCVISDITRREAALSQLKAREEWLTLAAQGAADGLWHWDLESQALFLSPRWLVQVGAESEPIGTNPDEWFRRVHPDDLKRLKARLESHIDGHTGWFEAEYRIVHTDGSDRWMLGRGLVVRDEVGQAVKVAGSQTDITERKLVEHQLLHDALHDDLTGLPNRALFMERLAKAIKKARRDSSSLFSVLFLDLDQFKMINDSLGHTVGDQLLVAVARRLEVFVRPGDTVARLGGDEFTVLLEDLADINDAMMIADRIQQELSLPFSLNGNEVFSTASIGIAVSTASYDRPGDVLRDADTAMYRAKARGRARHEVFTRRMHTQAVQLLQLETDLRRAVERREFRTHYQPIVSLKTGQIAGFEALVRWAHPERGLVSPDEFIPVAEETGLIAQIGLQVLSDACKQTRLWHERYPHLGRLSTTVNLSPTQLAQADLIEQVDHALKDSGLDARALRLEITESAVMEDVDAVTDVLLRLKNLNVQILMDDFGTGYSSLSYLHRFPIDMLKIDRSFVSRLEADGENSEIVRTIVMLARNLNLNVIAEGVETHGQRARLKALQCDYGQGFLFSRPIDADAANNLLGAAAHPWQST